MSHPLPLIGLGIGPIEVNFQKGSVSRFGPLQKCRSLFTTIEPMDYSLTEENCLFFSPKFSLSCNNIYDVILDGHQLKVA